MVRLVANVVLTSIAVALLGILVLLSTSVDESARRRADLNLRQLREIGSAVEREALNARNLKVDNGRTLAALSTDLHTSTEAVGHDLRLLFPADPDLLRKFRGGAEAAFNSIDSRHNDLADSTLLARRFAELNQSTDRFTDRIDAFNQNQTRFLQAHQNVTAENRALVQRLREHSQRPIADSLFRGVSQVLDRADRGGESDLAQIDAIVGRLEETTKLRPDDEKAFLKLLETMRALVPARQAVETNLADIISGRFQQQVSLLRELVTRDTLYRLTTMNDSRVLLNVYTVLLLVVLGYFGTRLQMSYRALNRSHADLEDANTSLEARVSARTHDLERAYEELQESQVQLVQAEKMSSLGQLVAGIVHEINTPLLYVLNNATVTAENVQELRGCVTAAAELGTLVKTQGADAPAVKTAIGNLAKSINAEEVTETIEEIVALAQDSTDGLNQISELIQSLKDFSRLDRAAEDRFDIHEGIDKTLLITRNLLKYGITVEKHYASVPQILCAPSRINQVFINLVTNAVQAMDGKGTLTITTRAHDGWVEICVRDTGSGIAPEHIDKIMDPFFTTKPVGQGTGLGLSIVRRIVDEHRGRISVESKVGVGTSVTISLPVDRADTTTQEAA